MTNIAHGYKIFGPGYTMPKSGVRTLHIEGVEYKYTIKGHGVQYFLDDKKVVASFPAVTGRSWNIIERGQHKKTSDGMITPKHCKAFLEDLIAKGIV